ncbi:MAG: DNA polymerase III subunit gamma/tau [bacterium]|nr:DNA polymerase III subunit gamma/tau [bacterium]
MMFYNKYRPQLISDLDSEKIRESLGKSILSNKFASAYLLIGPRGTGKTSTARLIAKALNCEKRKTGEEPCNKCDICETITNGSNLDVIEIDAASNTGVEDIRDLREKVKLAPSASKYKIYIIDEVHMLSNSAFNALLKTLEEPPGHVVFVLATTDPQKLPETIKSRCQVYEFGRGTIEEIIRCLRRAATGEKLKIDDEMLVTLAKMADGSFRDAHKLLEQVANGENIISTKIENLDDFIKNILDKNLEKSLEFIDSYSGQIKDLIEVVAANLHEELVGRIKPHIAVSELISLIKKIDLAYKELKGAVIQTIPLEIALIEWMNIKTEIKIEKPAVVQSVTMDFGEASWKELLEKTKSYNHSLTAVLRSAKLIGLSGKTLMIGVNYKFHLDKLSEIKNIETVEKVLQEITGQEMKVKYIKQEGG